MAGSQILNSYCFVKESEDLIIENTVFNLTHSLIRWGLIKKKVLKPMFNLMHWIQPIRRAFIMLHMSFSLEKSLFCKKRKNKNIFVCVCGSIVLCNTIKGSLTNSHASLNHASLNHFSHFFFLLYLFISFWQSRCT